MLSIRNLQTVEQAATYFAKDDYYHRSEQAQPSMWWGRGTELAGLCGDVQRDAFEGALAGVLPGGVELPHRLDDERRPGMDLTFSAPKSVSLLALVKGDRNVALAHESAVTEALTFLEEEGARARTTTDKVTTFEFTKNLLVARFSHDTSRELDPQLHTHSVVINATKRKDGVWRALSNERLYEMKMVGGAVYRAALSRRLQELGYEVDRTHADGRFEVRGFSETQLEHFSKRRLVIEEALGALNLSGAIASERVALRTREKKREVDRSFLGKRWRSDAEAIGIRFPDPRPKEFSPEIVKAEARRALKAAIDHLSERATVFSEDKLLAQALAAANGRASFRDIQKALRTTKRAGGLVDACLPSRPKERAYATHESLALERGIIASIDVARGQHEPILVAGQIQERLRGCSFTAGQTAAIELLLSSSDGIVGVQGYAGTGKTTALRAVRELAEARGYKARGFAPSATAALVLEEEAGIKSTTLARHLIEEARRPSGGGKKELWIVDEASMIGNRDAYRLLQAARKAGARVALVGDKDQLPSIEAGAAFRLLSDRGMALATMEEVLRQKDPALKQAVLATIDRKEGMALEAIRPSVEIHPETSERLDAVAKEYLTRDRKLRAQTLVLTGSNVDRRAINERIRAGLRAEGALIGRDERADVLVSRGFTDAETRECSHYKQGDVVRIGREYKKLGLENGEYLTVSAIDTDSNTVTLRGADGREVKWQPHRTPRVEVYRPERRELAAGDVIRWTRNDHDQDRRNGELGRVLEISGDHAVVEVRGTKQKLELSAERHWDHAYATTVHAAQGRTSDTVILHIDTEQKQLVGHESWYVAISRAREGVRIYTDDADRLPDRIAREMAQVPAIESVRAPAREQTRGRSL